MNAKHKVIPAVCCIALMSGCASNQTSSAAPWTVKSTATAKNSHVKPEAMYQLGRYYQGQNRFAEAVNAYQKALNADANFVEAYNGIGVVYSRQGKYPEAIAAFQAAIKLAPKAAHLYSNMGYAYYLQGQYADAVKALQQATMLDPGNQRALNNLGQAYAKAGNTTQSALAFSEAISVEKTNANLAPAPEPSMPVAAGNVTVLAAAEAKSAAQPVDTQMLAIPKDRGVIRTANPAPQLTATEGVPVLESRATLVPLAPNVSELKLRLQPTETIQLATVENQQNLQQLQQLQQVRLEVTNGNGVTGAAGKISKYLRVQGYATPRLSNKKPYNTQTTQIHYRAGYEAQAQLVQSKLLDMPQLVERNDMRANVSVRVVLGKDMVVQLAQYDMQTKVMQLAANNSSANTVKQVF